MVSDPDSSRVTGTGDFSPIRRLFTLGSLGQ
jgi:hypothetical protein